MALKYFIKVFFYYLAPCVAFSQSHYSIVEDKGSLEIVLIVNNPSTTDMVVKVFSIDGSATGKNLLLLTVYKLLILHPISSMYFSNYYLFIFLLGNNVDYNSGQYNVKIPAGSTKVPFNILISDDNFFEGDEEFYLIINKQSSLPNGTIIGSPNRATVKVFDNECKHKNCMLHNSYSSNIGVCTIAKT